MKTNNAPDWAKDIPVIRSAAITEIQRQIASGETAPPDGDQQLLQAALGALANMLENPEDGEAVALEIVHERYVTEDGQIVNPGIAKSVWDEALKRSGINPKKMVEYNVG